MYCKRLLILAGLFAIVVSTAVAQHDDKTANKRRSPAKLPLPDASLDVDDKAPLRSIPTRGNANIPRQPNKAKKIIPTSPPSQEVHHVADNKPDVPIGGDHHQKQSSTGTKLANDPDCRDDIKTLCSRELGKDIDNNFAVLECLHNHDRAVETLSDNCHHKVWVMKHDISIDSKFPSALKTICKTNLEEQCKTHKGSDFVSCMIEYRENVTDETCRSFLTKLSSLMFSDYRLIRPMLQDCMKYIKGGKCGRISSKYEADSDKHSQGAVLECLMDMEVSDDETKKLDAKCKHQILRVAEFQADDYHLDRSLYFACSAAREQFCKDVRAGDGRVYRCLMEHKFSDGMPTECTEKLTTRQKLLEEDVKLDPLLFGKCQNDVKLHCSDLVEQTEKRDAEMHLFEVLHCLNDAEHRTQHSVSLQCQGEMKAVQKQLMEDYMMTPALVSACKTDIHRHCGRMSRNGETLHCLMQNARPSGHEFKKDEGISKQCHDMLQELLEVADVENDINIDPVLGEACEEVVRDKCSHTKRNDKAIDCLMDLIGSDDMTPKCEDALLSVQYFAARDWKLDSELKNACESDAKRLCQATMDSKSHAGPSNSPIILPCLHKNMKEHKLQKNCQAELTRVMRLRSVSIDLQPEIEDECMPELAKLCAGVAHKAGGEMKCLTDNYEQLGGARCKAAVKDFIERVEEDPTMDKLLMRACQPMAERFCSEELDDESDTEALMDCLISHKMDEKMNRKCRAGIEHYQILALQDWHLSKKFRKACKKTIQEVCPRYKKKSDVIRCLSDAFLNDVLSDKPKNEYKIQRPCRKQLKAELFIQEEKLSLDPDILDACHVELKAKCGEVDDEAGQQLECLKDLGNSLSKDCHRAVFRREKIEAVDPRIDLQLKRSCKSMIVRFCADVPPDQLMDCLVDNKDDENFDARCHKIIIKRLRQDNQEVHLKPTLFKACKVDMKEYCMKIDPNEGDLQGAMIKCLRKQFLKDPRKLTRGCQHEMGQMVRDSVKDYKQDPVLAVACGDEIRRHCNPVTLHFSPEEEDEGKVEECLRLRLLKNEIKGTECKTEVARILMAGRADVHVDPLLYQACALELQTYCKDIPLGEGRQMSCLLSILEDHHAKMSGKCGKMLTERVNMWEYAAKVAPPESFGELWEHVSGSKSRFSFVTVGALVLLSFMLFGIVFGRVTKRVSREMKSK